RPRHHHVTLAHMIERFLGARGLGAFDRHLAWFGAVRASEALALLSPELRSAVPPEGPSRHARHLERVLGDMQILRRGEVAPLVAYQLLDFETYLPGDLLTKVDRCTMAHGVESRAPFLQAALVEHALTLPDAARLRGLSGKWVLRRVAEQLLPREILTRRKQGFSPPFSAPCRPASPAPAVTDRVRPGGPRTRWALSPQPAGRRSVWRTRTRRGSGSRARPARPRGPHDRRAPRSDRGAGRPGPTRRPSA